MFDDDKSHYGSGRKNNIVIRKLSKGRVRLTALQKRCIYLGVEKYGTSWKRIKEHYKLEEELLHKTTVQIKDGHRNILKEIKKGRLANQQYSFHCIGNT